MRVASCKVEILGETGDALGLFSVGFGFRQCSYLGFARVPSNWTSSRRRVFLDGLGALNFGFDFFRWYPRIMVVLFQLLNP